LYAPKIIISNAFSSAELSPPQRLLFVNTSERKKRKAGALERENGSAGNGGKREKMGARGMMGRAFPARFKFSLFPASARFYPARLWEASAEERERCRSYLRRFCL